jgi:hypothetical protein
MIERFVRNARLLKSMRYRSLEDELGVDTCAKDNIRMRASRHCGLRGI